MNRLWLIGGGLLLLIAAILGWLSASRNDQLDTALILADVTTPGCDTLGRVHLTLGNASGRTMTRVEGVLSVAAGGNAVPAPAGNFEVTGAIAAGQKLDACVPVEEPLSAGNDRATLLWLARATAIDFELP